MVRLRGPINSYYELGYTILCQNRSTCLNMYYEQAYFELITGETFQHECEKLINCVKANQTILAQTNFY